MCNNNCCAMQNSCGCGCAMQNSCGCGCNGLGGQNAWIWIILIIILLFYFGGWC